MELYPTTSTDGIIISMSEIEMTTTETTPRGADESELHVIAETTCDESTDGQQADNLKASYDEFVTLDAAESGTGNSYSIDQAAAALALCKKYIVTPYNLLLIVIGWRKLQIKGEKCSMFLTVFNVVYPLFMFVMLALTCIAQIVSCFSRTRSTGPVEQGSEYYVLSCDAHLVTLDVISYVMILLSYALAFYTLRIVQPEHLSTLAETVFLSFNDVGRGKSRRKPVFILLTLLFCGIIFVVLSIVVSVTRLFSLRLHQDTTIIAWFTNNRTAENQSEVLKLSMAEYSAVHYLLVSVAYFGFLFFDLLYIAVTINYCSQCQLLTYYIDNIMDKVRNKKYKSLNLAIKEIRQIFSFLKILNGNVAIVATLIFLVFISNVILSYYELTENYDGSINVATGFLNTIQWLMASLLPVLLAARLTASGNELRRLGQEIAARPFYYSDTPDLELQFFLTFTESTRYQVHLMFIPMQPSLVLGVGFFVLVSLSSGIIIPQVESVTWF